MGTRRPPEPPLQPEDRPGALLWPPPPPRGRPPADSRHWLFPIPDPAPSLPPCERPSPWRSCSLRADPPIAATPPRDATHHLPPPRPALTPSCCGSRAAAGACAPIATPTSTV